MQEGTILDIQQGSDEWARIRANRFTASEAAAVFGLHKYMSREDLMYQKKCQPEQEVDAAKQRLFNKGHEAEAAARPIAEKIIGDDLFPVVLDDEENGFLASMDGLSTLGDIGWEHKLLSESLAQQIDSGELEEHYRIQMDQQFALSGAGHILFTASDGTEENAKHLWIERDEDRIKRLIAGWDQFEKDLAEYEPPKHQAKAEGASPETLPALRIQVSGEVTDSNLTEFREHAMAVIQGINTDPQTDEDFATAEKTVKWCKDVEQRLDAAKDHALSQTQTIDELFRTLDEIKEQARQTRLNLDKQVKASKQAKRDEIYTAAVEKIRAHYAQLNESLGIDALGVPANAGNDVAAALKGKKTITSLQSAADEAAANAKLAANELAETVRGNLQQLAEHAPDHRFLFNDLDRVATKAPEDFAALVKQRISEYEQAEKERREREEQERQKRESIEAARAEMAEREEREQIAEAYSQPQELYDSDSQFQPKEGGIDLREDDYFHLEEIIGGDEFSALRYDENGNEYELTLDVRRKSLKRQDQAA